jgi:uncharacterized membrane protein
MDNKHARFFSVICLSICLVCALASVYSARIEGVVYDSQLNPIEKVIITINTTPEQAKVAYSGYFAFSVPQGIYNLTATKLINYSEVFLAYRTITIDNDGIFIIDLIASNSTVSQTIAPQSSGLFIGSLIVMIVVVVLTAGFFLWRRFHIQQKIKQTPLVQVVEHTPQPTTIYEKILVYITAQGGVVEQKSLRKQFGYSQAKISLLVDELFDQKKITKEKVGRSNMLRVVSDSVDKSNK